MSETPTSPLRRRMIEDMTVRNFVKKTRNDYIHHVRTFTTFLGRSPDSGTPEDLRRFQLHQTETGVRPPTINGAVAALRFFFSVTLERPDLARRLTVVRQLVLRPRRRLEQQRDLRRAQHERQLGGGIALDGCKWVACKPGFFLPVRVLSKLFRRLMLEKLAAAHAAGKLQFFGEHSHLAAAAAFAAFLAPLRTTQWFVYSKRPFAGSQAVLAYLARYSHRVAIANSRLIAADDDGVTFKWKDYRFEGRDRHKTMTLAPDEFIRRFLLHVLPKGFHRILHSSRAPPAGPISPISGPCLPRPSRQRCRSYDPGRRSHRHQRAWAPETTRFATPVASSLPTKPSRASIKPVPCAAPDRQQPSNPHRPKTEPGPRGFLPWRLSDAGPGAARYVTTGRRDQPVEAFSVTGPLCGLKQTH